MKFLTSVYREALCKDYENPVTEANAYDLQQILYKHNRVFGSVYKFENFRNVFSSAPVSSDSVTFLKFWKGIESLLYEDSRISPTMPDVLRKTCFADDPYVISMRYFRDEILKNEVSLTKTELIETINKSQQKSDLPDFWDKVIDNTKKMFVDENVSVRGVSYMVYTFFVKKYSLDLESTTETENEPMSSGNEFYESKTLTESEVDYDEQKLDFKLNHLKLDDSATDFKLDDSIWNYEYKYRKLLFDLETSLPKFYTCYSEAKSELSQTKEDLKKLTEANDVLKNQYSTEKMELIKSNKSLEGRLSELNQKNSELNSLLLSRDAEIENLTRRVDELTEMYNSSDSYKFSKELLVYKARCEGLERSNESLNIRIGELDNMIESLHQQQVEAKGLGPENEKLQSKNRDLTVENELLQSDNEELSEENKELVIKNERLEEERNELMEKIRNLEKELEGLKRSNDELQETVNKMEEESVSLRKEIDDLQSYEQKLSEENLDLKKKVENLKQKLETNSENEDISDGSNKLEDREEDSLDELRLNNELLQSELGDLRLFIEDYKIKMEDYKQTIENYKVTIERYRAKEDEYESDLKRSEETIEEYKQMIEKYTSKGEDVDNNCEESIRLLNELKMLKRESELLESEYMKLREENDQKTEELDRLRKEMDALKEENKYLNDKNLYSKQGSDERLRDEHLRGMKLEVKNMGVVSEDDNKEELKQKQSELEQYQKKLQETEKKLNDLEEQNSNLKEKFNDIIQENINLVAKLELMNIPSPKNATNKLMEMIGKYNDIQSPASYDSETTDYDISEPSEVSTMENRLKISSELAETRRLNTLNAIKFGLLKTNTDRTSRSSRSSRGMMSNREDGSSKKRVNDEKISTKRTEVTNKNRTANNWKDQERESIPIVYRKTGKLKRSVSIRDESPAESYYDSLSMSNYDELGISEEPDIIQSAISFISKKFNFK